MLVTEQSEEDLGNLAGLGTLWSQSHDQKKPGNGNETDLATQCANPSSLALEEGQGTKCHLSVLQTTKIINNRFCSYYALNIQYTLYTHQCGGSVCCHLYLRFKVHFYQLVLGNLYI